MAVYYVTNKKPKSHNKGGSDPNYKAAFQAEFQAKYSNLYVDLNLPFRKGINLKTNVTYIHKCQKGCVPDIDNLSKPIVDAFTGVIYEDDSMVAVRQAQIIESKDFQFVTVDATEMPQQIFDDLNDYYSNGEEHIVLFGVDTMEISSIVVGVI